METGDIRLWQTHRLNIPSGKPPARMCQCSLQSSLEGTTFTCHLHMQHISLPTPDNIYSTYDH